MMIAQTNLKDGQTSLVHGQSSLRHGQTSLSSLAVNGGVRPPTGFVFLTDSDGAYLTGSDGAYLVEAA